MKKHKCEMCGKTVSRISEHHIIPWRFSHDDSDSNILRVCSTCHAKADTSFISLILYGEISITNETSKRSHARYSKKYVRKKALHCIKLLKHTFYEDILRYNTKTGTIHISHSWWYVPYKYIDRRVKSRSQLSKAASTKGQTMLAGGN